MATRLWVCLTVVPGKFEVSAFRPAMELNSVLLPQLGWPTKMTEGTSGMAIRDLDPYLPGDPPADGDAAAGGDCSGRGWGLSGWPPNPAR